MADPLRALVLVGILAFLGQGPRSQTEGRKSPTNIVLFLSDDAGYADFGFQEHTRPEMTGLTPHIDSIAREGARLTDFYVSGAVCSPSRAGLLTGRYQQRFGHERNIPPGYEKGGLPLGEATIAQALVELGYETGCIGKWHLGYPEPYHPNERGFGTFYGCLQGSRSYFPYDDPTPHRVFLENREPTDEEGYVTDRIGRAAADFVFKNAEEPFFLFVSFTAPHSPLQARPEDLELEAIASIEKKRRRTYAAMVKAMDDNVGLVLRALEEAEVEERTLVVFTNDNGGQTKTGAVNTPLRGRKGQLWEGGTRVPCAIRWPGVVAPGRVIGRPVSALDLFPTFVTAGRGEVQESWALDGLDLGPLLRSEEEVLAERALYWRTQGSAGPVSVRVGRHKLIILDRESAPQLYDLVDDPSETIDLAAQQPELVGELAELIRSWEAELIEPLWGG